MRVHSYRVLWGLVGVAHAELLVRAVRGVCGSVHCRSKEACGVYPGVFRVWVVEAPGVSRCLGVVSSCLHRSGCCVVHIAGLQACTVQVCSQQMCFMEECLAVHCCSWSLVGMGCQCGTLAVLSTCVLVDRAVCVKQRCRGL